MEDDLKFIENGRRPHFFRNGRQPKFVGKYKMTSIFLKMEDDLNYFSKMKTTSHFSKMEDSLIFFRWKKKNNQKQSKVKTIVVAPLRVT